MENNDEFYIGYVDSVGTKTKKTLRNFVVIALGTLLIAAFIFAFFQRTSVNSSFDFTTATKVSGIYHESPYPMLRVQLAEDTYKDILLLGVGKFGANPYLDKIRKEEGDLIGRHLVIEGNLIYYNGKTLLQLDESQKVTIDDHKKMETPSLADLGDFKFEGEVVDPKCYYGVMKPGFGKIHRSCASLCIAGGIPPVLVTNDGNAVSEYFLLTDLKGNPIHKDILPYIGQPSKIKGNVKRLQDWYLLQIDVNAIEQLNKESSIY